MNYCAPTLYDEAAYERVDANERQAMAEQLAEEDWDAFIRGEESEYAAAVQEYCEEVAGDYIADMVRGGDYRMAAMRRLRTDCCGYRAEMMLNSDRVRDAL